MTSSRLRPVALSTLVASLLAASAAQAAAPAPAGKGAPLAPPPPAPVAVTAAPAPAPAFAPAPAPVAAAAPAPAMADPAEGLTELGWTGRYGLLFNVQNVFQNSSAGAVSGYLGGVGLQYTLDPQSALRLGVNLRHTSDPATERTFNTNGTVTKDFTAPCDAGETIGCGRFSTGIGLSATLLKRLSTSAWSPYFGLGGEVGFSNDTESWEDTTTPGETLSRDDSIKSFTLGGAGVAGLEWRLHKQIALYAEYGIGVVLLRYESLYQEDKFVSGGVTDKQTLESSRVAFLDFGTGVMHGGQLGLVAFW